MELNKILQGNCLDHLRSMPDDFLQCVITSPPYYGLRSYGTEPQVWDGNADCQHIWGDALPFSKQDNRTAEQKIAQGASVGSNIDFNDVNTTADSGSFCQRCLAWRGELGLEPRFQDYIRHLIQIFAEVKRVLKPDGTIFVNLGDSYAGSSMTGGVKSKEGSAKRAARMFSKPSDVQRGVSCDTSGIKLEDSQDCGCLCRSLCGACREVYRTDISRNNGSPVSTPILLLSDPSREHKELQNAHLPTSDSFQQASRTEAATQGSVHSQDREAEPLPASRGSTREQSSEQLLDECLQKASVALCLSCGCLVADDAPLSECTGACSQVVPIDASSPRADYSHTYDNASIDDESVRDNQGNISASPYLYSSTHSHQISLRPKSLLNIPHRFFISMTDELQFIQRNNINWWKRACMPSSAKDRWTVDFESIGFFTKNERYTFNQQLEAQTTGSFEPRLTGHRAWDNDPLLARGKGENSKMHFNPDGRNQRTTWDIPFEPSGSEHYASYPTRLVERMILAGSNEGDIVYDPFGGTATTAVTAHTLKRQWLCSELQPKYVEISNDRLEPYLAQSSLF